MMQMRVLLSLCGVIVFIAMISAAEIQVRDSPKWPPPSKHELGAWTVDDPPLLHWATAVTLPASVPILWMWAHNDGFAYALDDHQLIVCVPWILLVGLPGYFIGLRVEQVTRGQHQKSQVNRYVVLCVQVFVTIELFYATGVARARGTTTMELLFFRA